MKAREARQLAVVAGFRQRSTTALLELLLRLTPGERSTWPVARGTAWLCRELGYSRRTLIYARQQLTRPGIGPTCERCTHVSCLRLVGFVELERQGDGQDCSRYRVDIEALQLLAAVLAGEHVEIHAGERGVHSGEPTLFDGVDGGNQCTPPVQSLHPRGAVIAPPYAGGRAYSSSLDTPLPPARHLATIGGDRLPAASGGAPPEGRCGCPKARTAAQGGCRDCGTTVRQLAKARHQAARQLEHHNRRAAQLQARAEAAATREQLAAYAHAGLEQARAEHAAAMARARVTQIDDYRAATGGERTTP